MVAATTIITASFGGHLVYGIVLAAIVGTLTT